MNSFLAITYAFLLSYCPVDSYSTTLGIEEYKNATHVELELGLQILDCINVYAGEETYQVPCNNFFSWFPYTQSYWLGAEYTKSFSDKINLKAGIKHKCQHPVNCWGVQLSGYNRSVTELYVSMTGKIKLF